jgi:hypothetical protein
MGLKTNGRWVGIQGLKYQPKYRLPSKNVSFGSLYKLVKRD